MKTKSLQFLLLFFIIFISHFSFAQSTDLKKIEESLYNDYLNLQNSVMNNDDYEKTADISEKFSKNIKTAIKNPQTLTYPFHKLIDSNFCEIVTSDDGLVRFYSWNTETGGTMRIFDEIIQYKAQGKVYTISPTPPTNEEEWTGPGVFYSKIYTVNIGGIVYYLVISNGIYSGKDCSQSIQVYTIENNKLVSTKKLFKGKNKEFNRIDVNFDFFSVVDRPERPLELISYDKANKIVYIPVVVENGKVTNRFLIYKLKRLQFEFIGIETGKRE